jgi:hypothetical protein
MTLKALARRMSSTSRPGWMRNCTTSTPTRSCVLSGTDPPDTARLRGPASWRASSRGATRISWRVKAGGGTHVPRSAPRLAAARASREAHQGRRRHARPGKRVKAGGGTRVSVGPSRPAAARASRWVHQGRRRHARLGGSITAACVIRICPRKNVIFPSLAIEPTLHGPIVGADQVVVSRSGDQRG